MKPLPDNVELMRDVSAARWVVDGLRPWGKGGVPVASVVPEGFEAYARVPHEGQPDFGEGLPIHQLAALAGVLSGFTSTPDSCWMCVWSGYGYWSSRSSGITVLDHGDHDSLEEAHRLEAEFQRVMREREELLYGVPEVGEEYYLFHGSLSEVDSLIFEFDGSPESPNMWWTDDRAWCASSGIDLPATFVGGSRACIDAVITLLGASEVGPDDDVNERPTGDQ
jgi:hypothetical protein